MGAFVFFTKHPVFGMEYKGLLKDGNHVPVKAKTFEKLKLKYKSFGIVRRKSHGAVGVCHGFFPMPLFRFNVSQTVKCVKAKVIFG